MSTHSLSFTGPEGFARIELLHLLQEFPQIVFVERASGDIDLHTADAEILERLRSKPHWRLQEATPAAPARKVVARRESAHA